MTARKTNWRSPGDGRAKRRIASIFSLEAEWGQAACLADEGWAPGDDTDLIKDTAIAGL